MKSKRSYVNEVVKSEMMKRNVREREGRKGQTGKRGVEGRGEGKMRVVKAVIGNS